MKFVILISMTVLISCSQQDVHKERELGSIRFYGNDLSFPELRNKSNINYPRYLNVPFDTSYRVPYPNPGSPSLIPPTVFVLYDTSDIHIELLNETEDIILDYFAANSIMGYYIFIYNSKLSNLHSLYINQWRNKLRFSLNDSIYVVPLIPGYE
jgi:hypothetical protein